MPVTTEVIRSGPFTPDGIIATFPYTFSPQSEDEIEVVLVDESGSETVLTGWTATAIKAPGSVIMDTAPEQPDGETEAEVYVRLKPSFQQPVDFENQGAFNPSDHNETPDRGTHRAQWLRARLNRVPFLLPESSVDEEGNPIDGDGNPREPFTFPEFDGPYVIEFNSDGVLVAFRSLDSIITLVIEGATSEVYNIITQALGELNSGELDNIITVLETNITNHADTQIIRVTDATDEAVADIEAYTTDQIAVLQALIDTEKATGYAQDVGAVNALEITLAPAPTLAQMGQGAWWIIRVANTNSGPVTLSVQGEAPVAVKYPGGAALGAGALVANGTYVFSREPTYYQVHKDPPAAAAGGPADYSVDWDAGWERRGDVIECWGRYPGGSTRPVINFPIEFLVPPVPPNGFVWLQGIGGGNSRALDRGDQPRVKGTIPYGTIDPTLVSETQFRLWSSSEEYDVMHASNHSAFDWFARGKYKAP